MGYGQDDNDDFNKTTFTLMKFDKVEDMPVNRHCLLCRGCVFTHARTHAQTQSCIAFFFNFSLILLNKPTQDSIFFYITQQASPR